MTVVEAPAASAKLELLGLQSLVKFPDVRVVLVSGQANYDAAVRMFPANPVLAWEGGVAGLGKYYLGHLAARNVIVWLPNCLPQVVNALAELLAEWEVPAENMAAFSPNLGGCWSPAEYEARRLPRRAILDHLKPLARPARWRHVPALPESTPEPVAPPAPSGEAVRPLASVTPIAEARTRQQAKTEADPEPLPALYSHDALAQSFSALHGERWRHVAAWGKWLHWIDGYWRHDSVLQVFNLIRVDVCRAAAVDAARSNCTPATVRSIVHANTITGVERVARSDPAHARGPQDWDADPWVLNTPGGVVDLRNGSVRAGRPDDLCTRITRATPQGNCPLWCQFLIETTQGNGELIAFLQRMAGYFLTGVVRDHALFFVHGAGGNGKGTFLRAINWILGDYEWTAAMDVFMEQKQPQHKTELASFFGKRLVSAQEVGEGCLWNEPRINALTGGDTITANFMRQDQFTFVPTHKLIVVGNHKPIFRNVGDAIRRRLHLIPFTNKITAPDVDLDAKLRAEADGILRWMLAGCLEWQRIGLAPPEIVRATTSKYLATQDSFTLWLEQCCEPAPGLTADYGPVFKAYQAWVHENGESELGRKRFTEALETRGHEVFSERKHTYIRGLRLLQAGDAAQYGAANGYAD